MRRRDFRAWEVADLRRANLLGSSLGEDLIASSVQELCDAPVLVESQALVRCGLRCFIFGGETTTISALWKMTCLVSKPSIIIELEN